MAEALDTVSSISSVFSISGEVQRMAEGLDTASSTPSVYTPDGEVQRMTEGLSTVSTTSSVYTLSEKEQRIIARLDTVSTTPSVYTLSGRVQGMGDGLDTVSTTANVHTPDGEVQTMTDELDPISTTPSIYILSEEVQRMGDRLDTVSTTSSVGTLSTKVQLGRAECDTCLETRLVWTRACCLVKTCLPCLEAYVKRNISDGVIDIQCPGHSCDIHLTSSVIKGAVDTDKAKRFSFLYVKSDKCRYMTCKECKTNFCYSCGIQTTHPRSSQCKAPGACDVCADRRLRESVRTWADRRRQYQQRCRASRTGRKLCKLCCGGCCWVLWFAIAALGICYVIRSKRDGLL